MERCLDLKSSIAYLKDKLDGSELSRRAISNVEYALKRIQDDGIIISKLETAIVTRFIRDNS